MFPESAVPRQIQPPHHRLQDAGAEEGVGIDDAGGHAGEGAWVHFFHAGPAEGEAGGAETRSWVDRIRIQSPLEIFSSALSAHLSGAMALISRNVFFVFHPANVDFLLVVKTRSTP